MRMKKLCFARGIARDAPRNGGLGNVDKWLDNKDYSDDGKTLKVVPFPETDNYRKLVEQNKSIYEQLYFKK